MDEWMAPLDGCVDGWMSEHEVLDVKVVWTVD